MTTTIRRLTDIGWQDDCETQTPAHDVPSGVLLAAVFTRLREGDRPKAHYSLTHKGWGVMGWWNGRGLLVRSLHHPDHYGWLIAVNDGLATIELEIDDDLATVTVPTGHMISACYECTNPVECTAGLAVTR
ncbi:hypothetical protein [Kutzneria albida]|uniref:Uncharacterized protein n=1 Tax=Kutzneria albida DSM 43870 TaxID=1449976 RepID=W5WCI0_9PSEU|nr:hypothetical protein [Kutzneria albida]AHH98236.1 hypothetical protein KALB_4874 [Kutzneria albida DSM 43870]